MIAVVACALLAAAAPARHAVSVAEAGAAPAAFPSTGTIPVVAEHRYRMAAKVRILLFWVGRDNVGGARIRWRRGEDGAYGYDLLIGSDPARAPRQINRWGFILEESHGTDASVVGLMKRTDEDSLDEAKSNVATEASHGIDFKMITAHSDGRESTATVTVTRVPRDFSYRELEPLTDLLSKSAGVTRVRTVALPAGATAGLLCGVAELLHDAVAAVARDRHAPKPRAVPFAYYGKQYDLTRTSAEILTNATYEDVTYPRLIQVQFTVRARGGSSAESFVIVSGVDGALAEIPVFVSYQPKWWFRVDMVLDSRERF
jgi:hypothetical protein